MDATSRVTQNLLIFCQPDLQVLLAIRTMELYVLNNQRSCSSLLLRPPPRPPSSLWIPHLSAKCSFSGKHRNVTQMFSFISSRSSSARQSWQAAKQSGRARALVSEQRRLRWPMSSTSRQAPLETFLSFRKSQNKARQVRLRPALLPDQEQST